MARLAKLAVGQMTCRPKDTAAILVKVEALAARAAQQGAQVICFPEVCLGGAESAEPVPGPVTDRLGDMARRGRLAIVCGLVEKNPAGRPYNSCVLMDEDGKLRATYRKRCLYLKEDEGFSRGDRNVVVDLGFARAALTICYDIVFARYMNELVDAGAELIINPTAWMHTPMCAQWRYPRTSIRALHLARAMENVVFLMSANHWGKEDPASDVEYVGQSAIIAPWGEVLGEVRDGEGVAVAEVDFDKAMQWHNACAPYRADRRRWGF